MTTTLLIPLTLWGTLFLLQKKIQYYAPKMEVAYSSSPISGNLLRLTALEYKEVIADITWLKAIQFLGERDEAARKRQDYRELFDLINRVTDMDKRFEYAYEVGGIGLSILSDRFDLSDAILQKGLNNNVSSWRIPFYLGFNQMYFYKDFEKAAYYMKIAMTKKNAPTGLSFLAASLYQIDGDTKASLIILEEIYHNAPNEQIKEEAKNKILQLQQQ